jgi:hypothetical protein
VPQQTPPFIAQGTLLVVMPQEQREFVYQGSPASSTGDFTTLTVPLGAIVEDIARQVFGACFAHGVEFVEALPPGGDYVVALLGDMRKFTYSYTKVIEQGFSDDADVLRWITPELEIAFDVVIFDRGGSVVLEKTYDSGLTAGESYLVTNRPAERINRTLHATLHALMLQVASDLRPLLVGECEVADVGPGI